MKFGGTSVRDHDRIRVAAGLVRDALSEGPVAVVVSALGRGHRPALEIARSQPTWRRRLHAGLRGARRAPPQRWSTGSRTPATAMRSVRSVSDLLGEIRLLVSRGFAGARVQPANARQDRLHRRAAVVAADGGHAAPARRRRRSVRRPRTDRHRSLVRQRGGAVRGELRAHPRALREAAESSRSSPASSARPSTARPRRSGAAAPTTRRRSSAWPSVPSGSRSGPTSTACCRRIRAGSRPRSRCRDCPTTSCSSSRTSAPRWSIRPRCIRRARRRSRS